ncbi:PTS transporter subunit EIIB [Burkholderia stagnalis]|uniref:PTS transporter subunit EIIB n=1 Tax=Burkholderia stagnalis TaxID=1503054 RepID=UPI00325BC576
MSSEQGAQLDALAHAILGAVGGAANVERHFHCMTRLRIVLVDADRADLSALKASPAVLGVVAGNPLQIVIGPGAVAQASAAFADALAASPAVPAAPAAPAAQPETAAPSREAATRAARKNTAPSRFLRRIASIFTPLIPALIGAGLLNVLASSRA